MWSSLLADIVLVLHMGFVFFVLFGGLLSVKWPRAMRLHVPALAWGATVEFTGWLCPLTPLENWLRMQGGEAGDQGDFVLRYLLSILYPGHLTPGIQTALGATVLVVNVMIYGLLWRKRLTAPPR